MRISLVIPTLRKHDGLQKVLDQFTYNESIVVDDTDLSLAAKLNKGMRLAKGDYIVVSNDDVEMYYGDLKDLCRKNTVLSPRIHGGTLKTFHAHMFCIPRNIYASVGGFDESYPGPYYIDSDLWIRLKDAGHVPQLHETMVIQHNHPASTLRHLETNSYATRQRFIEKWGENRLVEVGA